MKFISKHLEETIKIASTVDKAQIKNVVSIIKGYGQQRKNIFPWRWG